MRPVNWICFALMAYHAGGHAQNPLKEPSCEAICSRIAESGDVDAAMGCPPDVIKRALNKKLGGPPIGVQYHHPPRCREGGK